MTSFLPPSVLQPTLPIPGQLPPSGTGVGFRPQPFPQDRRRPGTGPEIGFGPGFGPGFGQFGQPISPIPPGILAGFSPGGTSPIPPQPPPFDASSLTLRQRFQTEPTPFRFAGRPVLPNQGVGFPSGLPLPLPPSVLPPPQTQPGQGFRPEFRPGFPELDTRRPISQFGTGTQDIGIPVPPQDQPIPGQLPPSFTSHGFAASNKMSNEDFRNLFELIRNQRRQSSFNPTGRTLL